MVKPKRYMITLEVMNALFVLSIFSGLIFNAMYNLGFAFEKKAISKLPKEQINTTKKFFFKIIVNPLWLLGFFLSLFSMGFYFVALLWAPLSAVAPLAGFGLITLVIYAHLNLKEFLKPIEIISFILIIAGISLSSYIVSLAEINFTWNIWSSRINSLESILFLSLSFVVSGIILIFLFLIKNKKSNFFLIAIFTGIVSGIQSILVKGFTVWIDEKVWLFNISIILIYIFLLILSGIFSTGVLQFAFKKGKVSIIMAIYNGLSVIYPIIFGGLILNEWVNFSVRNLGLLIFSIVLTLVGIVILSLNHTYPYLIGDSGKSDELGQ